MRWFEEHDLETMTVPVIERIESRIRSGDIDGALALCEDLTDERIILHDLLAEAATALATWLARELGEDSLYEAFVFVFEQSAVRQVYSLVATGADRGIEAAMLARNCWVAHSCSGAGEHGGCFEILEDDEKFTFVMDPCGSGGRMWRKGLYEGSEGFALTECAHPWSYNRRGFPAYCTHCAVLNELLPYRHLGYFTWPVEPPADAAGPCRWYVYKDRLGVPARFYERFGLDAPSPVRRPGKDRGRYFTREQLERMAESTPSGIMRTLDRGDLTGALRLCRRRGGEFLFLFNLYVNALACCMDLIARKSGEDGLGSALDYVYTSCIEKQIVGIARSGNLAEAVRFLTGELFLAGTCGGSGIPRSRIRVVEGDSAVTIVLDPCPAAGKLLMRGSYDEPGRYAGRRERSEDAVLRMAVRARPPRAVMDRAVFPLVDYITETRKPRGLARLERAHYWTMGKSGVPSMCALCLSALARSGSDRLGVSPPTGPDGRCTWRFRK
ncbi:MAG: hypothetical protein KKF41_10610 [Actinobacteria bacterium]|nr:hypothetical protein [Actinomycetota bacterium]MBU1944718.1 hypothetical protein [Actinomycetota bacterium]MBU2688024.1 hypothetical protein [Actinomycetota bacterium]